MRAGRVRRPVGSANALPPVRPVIAGRPWARLLRREGQGGPSTHPRLCRDGPAPHGPMGPRGCGSMAASPHRTVRWEGHVSQEPADPTASSAPPDGTSPTIPSEGADVQPEPLPVEGNAAGGDAPADAPAEAAADPARTSDETSAAILAAVAAAGPGAEPVAAAEAPGVEPVAGAEAAEPAPAPELAEPPTEVVGPVAEAVEPPAEAGPAAPVPPRRGPWRTIAGVLLLVLLAAALGFGGAFLVPALVDVPVPNGALSTTPAPSPTPAPTASSSVTPSPSRSPQTTAVAHALADATVIEHDLRRPAGRHPVRHRRPLRRHRPGHRGRQRAQGPQPHRTGAAAHHPAALKVRAPGSGSAARSVECRPRRPTGPGRMPTRPGRRWRPVTRPAARRRSR